ncbi:ER membrane protein complex subunit 5 [Hanseniaspora uvarum DSM 2768]|nr:ER membrane protein complex subunit 5 [Hanseniaspora uvarum DSM 2768]
MSALSKILLIVGLLQIIHSGYSIHQFNSISKLVNTSNITSQLYLPFDVKAEVYSGLIITIISILLSFDKIEYIKLSENKIVRTNERLLPIKTNITNGHEALIINGNENSLGLQKEQQTVHFIDFKK